MTNYQLGKIYRIVCNLTGLTYYGSTCEPTLARRLAVHVGNLKYFKRDKTKKYTTSFKILEGGNYTIVLVELFPCDKKMELHQRERFYIEGNVCVNKNIPTRTRAEYKVDNRIQISEYRAKYILENADKIKTGQAKYNKENADKLKIQQAEYRKENVEKKKIQNAEYRKENADKIKIKQAEFRANNPEKTKLRDAKSNQKAKERLANSKLNVPII
jgi:hypothetical protein